jgi:hypothetical protein
MKKLMTAFCCLCLAFVGYNVTKLKSTISEQNTLTAATIPSWNYNGQLPLDLQLDAAKRLKPDTIEIHDTVYVNNTKYIRVPVPQSTTDTIYVPMADLPEIEILPVKNRSPGNDSIDEGRTTHSVVLIIDGNKVYSSKTEHSEVSDEP